ncbi:MAG: hypothetical protein ACE5H8_07645 [Alphaproteobacteria bacterium]
MSASAVETELTAASAWVSAAREALTAGQTVDLAGLAEKVDGACRDLAALPATEARRLEGRLLALYDELNALAEIIAAEYAGLKQALGNLGAHRQASSAYRKTTDPL